MKRNIKVDGGGEGWEFNFFYIWIVGTYSRDIFCIIFQGRFSKLFHKIKIAKFYGLPKFVKMENSAI
jgi:hypothetical protein